MKLIFPTIPLVPLDIQAAHADLNRRRGLPHIRPAPPHDIPLAVVGSGPSVAEHVDELRHWSGDIWAINNAYLWCRRHGIPHTFMTADPGIWDWRFYGGERALIGITCDPAMFEALRDCRITTFELGADGVFGASTTASVALSLGPVLGYRRIAFFGCESSYDGRTHVDEELPEIDWIVVECGGRHFTCNPQMAIQAENMAPIIRACPGTFEDRSGGLLGALIEHGEFDVVAANPALAATIVALETRP